LSLKQPAEMETLMSRPRCALGLCLIAVTIGSGEMNVAWAQSQPPPTLTQPAQPIRSLSSPSPSVWKDLFAGTATDVKNIPSVFTAGWLAVGSMAALGSFKSDPEILSTLSKSQPLHETLEPGAIIGQTTLQLGASLATYAYGRTTNHPKMVAVGADLFRSQILAEGMTLAMKHAVRRDRPEGSGYAFPSGHTTVTFASATVLQRHFGWKTGVPAYLVAAYVGMSRVQMKRHNFSDVAMGAALGIVAGHAVTLGRRLELGPMAAPGGGGVSFTWKGKP